MRLTVDGIIYELQSTGGISRLYSEILPRMCEIDGDLKIKLLTQDNCLQDLPTHQQITHKIIPSFHRYLRPHRIWDKYRMPLRTQVLRWYTNRCSKDIWHSTYFTLPWRWRGPVVVTVYDMIYEIYKEQYSNPEDNELRSNKKKCVLESDAIISISKTTSEDLQAYYGISADKIKVIPLSYSSVFQQRTTLTAAFKLPSQKPFLLFVGRRSHNKNFNTLISAYSIWSKRSEVDLIAVGTEWTRDEREQLVALGIHHQVFLVKDADDEFLCQLYNQALAFVYPSLYEGFGIPILEAMACGCSVIASRIPSSVEIAADCPIYFEANSKESLLEALSSAYDKERESERKYRGLQIARTYSWDYTARETLRVYSSLV